jgi:PAS domain S-box-containing protein
VQRYIDELRLLHAIRLAVVATDVEGRLTFVNDAAAELYRGTPDQLLGTNLVDYVTDPARLAATQDAVASVLAGDLWRGDISLRALDGSTFVAAIVAAPLLDADGASIGMVVVSDDITDLRIAEAERAASEQRLRLAHKAAGLGSWQWDMATGENIWDARLEEIYGLPVGGFGGSWDAWMALLHPDDIPQVLETVNAAMAEPGYYLLKTRVVWPDQETVRSIEAWGEVTTDDRGNPTGTIGCVRDVTRERETEEALAQAMEAERLASRRTALLLEVATDLSRTTTVAEVQRAVEHHLDKFVAELADRAELAVPPVLTAVESGRDLALSGYDDLEPADRTVLDALAAQCAAAAQRADLLARTTRIAEDLQLGLAASALPEADLVEIAVRCHPGGDELEHVGGDWYDAVRTREGHLAVVVGDVMGRGVRAATTMVRVRAALRGLIAVDPTPELLLAFADDVLERDAPDQFVTAAAALIDPVAHTLRLSLAGHVPLLLVHPDGRTELHGDESGIPLGVQPDVVRRSETIHVPTGAIVVLVTDGVVESRAADLDEGLARLSERASELRDRPLEELVDALAALADSSMRDDVTVLAIRMG